jgi:hypothetical protein
MNKSLKKGLVQFWLNPNNEHDQQRLQVISAWKQDKTCPFVDRMRDLIDRAMAAETHQSSELDQRMHHIETLLRQVHERVMTGDIVLPPAETQQLESLVNLEEAAQWGV